MRIDKYLTQLKYTTRPQVKNYLKSHVVRHKTARVSDPKIKIDPNHIYIDDQKVFYKEEIHLMINKPKGYVCATKDNIYPSVLLLLKEPYNRFDFKIAGRLDVDTTGLLILSTNGHFIHELTHPKKHVEKTYMATLDHVSNDIDNLLSGVMIKDDKQQIYLAKAIRLKVEDLEVEITIDQGKYHQVKRMFKAVGCNVLQLKRIKIGNISLNKLNESEYLEIRKEDIYD
jgi:16S rRNA pseudouridine516 synthase